MFQIALTFAILFISFAAAVKVGKDAAELPDGTVVGAQVTSQSSVQFIYKINMSLWITGELVSLPRNSLSGMGLGCVTLRRFAPSQRPVGVQFDWVASFGPYWPKKLQLMDCIQPCKSPVHCRCPGLPICWCRYFFRGSDQRQRYLSQDYLLEFVNWSSWRSVWRDQ